MAKPSLLVEFIEVSVVLAVLTGAAAAGVQLKACPSNCSSRLLLLSFSIEVFVVIASGTVVTEEDEVAGLLIAAVVEAAALLIVSGIPVAKYSFIFL